MRVCASIVAFACAAVFPAAAATIASGAKGAVKHARSISEASSTRDGNLTTARRETPASIFKHARKASDAGNGGRYEKQEQHAGAGGADAQTIDGIAARIDADVITESEVRELAAFQTLVDGSAKPRGEVIRELTDQWIVNGEAGTARFPHPTDKDVDTAYAELEKQFASTAEFERRCASAGLTVDSVRRELAAQIYLSRFLDFRFRPAAEVSDADIQGYYDEEFAPQLKAKGEAVPPLDKVQDTIREVLIQRDITKRANQWLDDTRSRLEIDVLPAQGGAQ